jgi:formyltetrahydrofolate synthetase
MILILASRIMNRQYPPLFIKICKFYMVENGFSNLKKHIENVRKFGLQVVVAINRFEYVK